MQKIVLRKSKFFDKTNNVKLFKGEKNADYLQILIPTIYNNIELTECNVRLTYITPDNNEHSFLIDEYKQDGLYKDTYISYLINIEERFTSLVGEIPLYITITESNESVVLKSDTTYLTIDEHPKGENGLTPEEIEIIDQVVLISNEAKQNSLEALDKSSEALENSEEAKQIAQSVRDDADNGVFDGEDGYTPVKGTDYFTEQEIEEIEQGAADKVDLSGLVTQDDFEQTIEEVVDASGNKIRVYVDLDNYRIGINLLNKNNELLSGAMLDLPLEDLVSNASYNAQTKRIVLNYLGGNTNSFSIAELIDGLATTSDLNTGLVAKVDKIQGKGLSSNDFTDAEKEKLGTLENYDDSDIKQNFPRMFFGEGTPPIPSYISNYPGVKEKDLYCDTTAAGVKTALFVATEVNNNNNYVIWRKVEIAVDSSLSGSSTNPVQNKVIKQALDGKANISDIPDVSNFITKSVDDLLNYYLKSETYTKTEVNNLISAVQGVSFLVVNQLPTVGTSNIIYLVPSASAKTANVKDEYIWINNAWEQIGSTAIDLSNYVTITDLNNALSNYTTTSALTNLLNGKQDVIDSNNKLNSDLVDDTSHTNKFMSVSEKEKLASLSNYDDAEIRQEIADIKAKEQISTNFSNYSNLVSSLNVESKNKYNVGQGMFVNQRNIPDLWIAYKSNTSTPYTYTSDEKFLDDLNNSGVEGLKIGYYYILAIEAIGSNEIEIQYATDEDIDAMFDNPVQDAD